MSQIKYNFLNWRPDLEKHEHDGLVLAQNVLHDSNGYYPIKIQTTTAFATQQPLGAGFGAYGDLKVKPFGNAGELACAGIQYDTATTNSFSIGVVGNGGGFTSVTMATLSSVGAARIKSFDVSDVGQWVVIAAQAEGSLLSGGTTVYSLSGTFGYTITSV
jgi:hypothetical protein